MAWPQKEGRPSVCCGCREKSWHCSLRCAGTFRAISVNSGDGGKLLMNSQTPVTRMINLIPTLSRFIKLLQCLTQMIIGLAIAIRFYHAAPDESSSMCDYAKGRGETKGKMWGKIKRKLRRVNAAFDGSPRKNPAAAFLAISTRVVLCLTLIKFSNCPTAALLIRHMGLLARARVLPNAKPINLHRMEGAPCQFQ